MAETTEEKKKRNRRPKAVLLRDKMNDAETKIAYHEKHLASAREELATATKALELWEKEQSEGAEDRIAKLEAELEALRSIAKNK